MFKPSSAKQNLCDECAAKERAARAAAKAAPAKPTTPVASIQSLKITGPGANILAPGMAPTASASAPAPEVGLFGAAARRQEEAERRAAANPPHVGHGLAGQVADRTEHGVHAERPAAAPAPNPKPERPAKAPKTEKAPRAPRPPREPRPAPQPFQLSDEQRAQVEARYLELAQPIEFDGIRSQIAGELNLPKAVVKKAVGELRARMQLPSWWDLQAFTGAPADLERIRDAYTPLLPTPEIGVHKQMAADLGIDPRQVYQGIRRIRAELRLPQYNPPDAHPETEQPVADGAEVTPDGAATTEVASA
jgi:hypothetical protein